MPDAAELQRKGRALQRIWEDTDFQSVFQQLREETIARWTEATTKDTREDAHAEYRALLKVQQKFHALIERGQHADRLDTRTRTQKSASQQR